MNRKATTPHRTRTLVCLSALLLSLAPQLAAEVSERAKAPVDPIVGASVVGPSTNQIGVIKDIVVDRETGQTAMYLVRGNGWFDGLGVIPLSAVVANTILDERGAGVVSVTVNAATFDNIATWDGKGPVARYLRSHRSILATVYGMDADALGRSADRYELASGEDDPAVASADMGR